MDHVDLRPHLPSVSNIPERGSALSRTGFLNTRECPVRRPAEVVIWLIVEGWASGGRPMIVVELITREFGSLTILVPLHGKALVRRKL